VPPLVVPPLAAALLAALPLTVPLLAAHLPAALPRVVPPLAAALLAALPLALPLLAASLLAALPIAVSLLAARPTAVRLLAARPRALRLLAPARTTAPGRPLVLGAAGLLVALAALPPAAPAQPAAAPFSAEERARILAHGPWPQPFRPDPSNRASGQPAAIELGRRLFFDARLSAGQRVACVSCHQPDRAWTDGAPRATGLTAVDRNTPTLDDVRLQRWLGWGGASDSLWLASIRPLLDEREMGLDPLALTLLYARDAALAVCYRKAFGESPTGEAERTLVGTAKAIAAFLETLDSGRTPFDHLREALARDDRAAVARYPADAARGLRLFVGRGNCIVCHSGPRFSNGEFHDIGIPFFLAPGVVDSGRHAGIRAVRASDFNRLSRHSDDASGRSALATRHVTLEHRHWGQFRVPGLRNVAVTAPYMHDGSLPTLRAVVRHYSELDEERLHADGERLLRPLRLTAGEIDDLVAFLESLTDAAGRPRPRPAADPRACD